MKNELKELWRVKLIIQASPVMMQTGRGEDQVPVHVALWLPINSYPTLHVNHATWPYVVALMSILPFSRADRGPQSGVNNKWCYEMRIKILAKT